MVGAKAECRGSINRSEDLDDANNHFSTEVADEAPGSGRPAGCVATAMH